VCVCVCVCVSVSNQHEQKQRGENELMQSRVPINITRWPVDVWRTRLSYLIVRVF